ncbi:MAG: trypsin-like peptidase domain-containing protein, partial [Myxococcota bacterium]|nr:trypsin-like peptidase domain-containing protein [Myxococcota bacterium]
MFMILFSLVGWAQELSWEGMIQSYSNAIVSIKIASNRNFDTEKAGTGVATGFVVDAKNGLILTNRHVVEPGPVSSYAVLMNNEEIPLVPVYRDPVHDFGFYRYNPKDVQYMELPEIQLCSKCAQMGLEVRLIGNNAGEKISILPGTLARLDRNAPNYGTGKYNDFNTFYIQAAAGSSGGSSGSPVLSKEGMAVALNAGGSSRSASSFFLPLDRVERALALIQENQSVKRGTLEATFKQIPYDYASRLGVSKENTDAFRKAFPNANGLLVIQSVLSKGVSDQKLMTGDVLISLNEKLIKDFVSMETILDSAVGQTVDVVVERGGEVKRFVIPVQDLHSITPDKFVEACGGIFHELSYQMARHYNVPIQGVFIANDGYCFDVGGVKRKAVLTAVNGVRLESIEQFWSIIKAQEDGVDLDVEFYYLSDRLRVLHTAVPWSLKWFPTIRWTRNDTTGIWDKEEVPRTIQKSTVSSESPSYSKWDKRLERTLAPSLVTVDFKIPYLVEGVYGDEFRGTGLILEEGLVAVDKDTVPIALGDAHITFAGQVRVPARVEWLHPEHNIALI